MHVGRRHHRRATWAALDDVAFWLVVMTIVTGLAALMWSTATGGL